MRRALPVAAAALLAAALAGTLALGGDDLLDRARAAYADRDFARGAALFAEAVKKDPAGPGSDYAAMMVVRGLALGGLHAEAAEAGEAYLRDRPTSVHRELVAFLAGNALLTAGKGAGAAEMLGASVDRLAAPEARAAVAAACVAEGDRALAGVPPTDPFATGTPPDPARALRLYSLARAAGLPAEGKAAVLLNLAKAAVAARGSDAAIDALAERTTLLPAADPDAEGLLLRGRALLDAGRTDTAREALSAVVARAPTSAAAPEALFLLNDAVSLDRLAREYPASPLAPRAALGLGYVLLARGETDRAVTAFLDAAARFPASEEAPRAALAAADALLAAGLFDEAKTRFGEFLERFKDRPEYAIAREKMLDAWYRDGARLIEAGEIEKGSGVLAALRAAFPISPFAAKSLLVEARAVAPERALALLGELLARYPSAPEAPEAGLLVAEILAERPGRVADAVAALRRVAEQHKGSPAAEQAEERLAEMRAESLEVELPAPILPGDPTDLVVRTRNLKKLTGRVYRLDPAGYFRTRGSFAGFDRVAVDVIASDAIFAGEVPAYEDYRRIEWKLRVPFEGEGAAVVVLEGGDLRAAGLILVSGVTVLTKESPFGVVTFVQDARSGQPVPGAKVLVRSSGDPLREVVTGEDGTVRVDFASRSERCDVLAIWADSIASDAFAHAKRNVRGLATTFHVSTDRPAYRPGQTVSYRAVVRRGAGEFFETPSGEPVKVSVHDATGNRLHFLDAKLSGFGTVAASFELPADLPPGALEIVVTHAAGEGKGSFRVEAYRKPQLLLEITPERPVFVRGEAVKVVLAARYAFGLPVRDLDLTVTVTGPGLEREMALVTDAAGRTEFEVPTEAGPAAALHVRVEAVDATRRLYVAEAEVPLAAAAYAATVTAARADLATGEEVRIRVLTADALGNPVAAEGKLEVGRAPLGTDEPRFVSVETLPVATDAGGAADLFVTVKEPGRYRFRFRGLDRAGREVRAHADATATPGADRIVVRAARAEVAVGEKIDVALRAPRGGIFALLAFEGEDVYGYRVLEFDGPEATLSTLATARFAPDVRIEVAAIAGGKLLLGSDRVTVRERIVLTVTPARAGYLPGELCRLTLTAKDDAGNPVRAEVALAVADEGLFRLFPDRTPDLVKTFRPPDREHLVRTGASIDFAVRAVTTALSEDLKKERDRREKPAAAKAPILLAEKSLEDEKDFEGAPVNDAIGIGGGAGGEFGGRGGHRNLRAAGGGAKHGEDLSPTRRQFEDTAFFRADVVTGADGTAVVEFPLPDDLAEWRITARGASHGNAFGEAKSSFVTARPLVIRAALPRFLREGDRLTAGAGVVNGTGEALRATVELSPAAKDGAALAELDLPAGAELFRPWPLPVAAIGEATYLAKVTAGAFADSEERKVPSLAYGIPWRDGFSGVASDGIERVLELPEDFVPGTVKLTLHAAPSPERLAADLWPDLRDFPHGCVEQTVDRFWPALELAAAIRALGLDAAERLPGLDRAVKAGALRLTYLRNEEGLWGWFGKCGSDPEMTAFALLGLARARDAGVEIAPAVFTKAGAALPALLAKTTDPDARAFLLLAGARAFGADHAAPAAAFADRRRLGLAGLARLALAYEPLGRTTQGDMLVEEILAKLATPTGETTEALGFALAALCGADVPEERLWPAFFALAARREGDGFGSTRESGVALFALARAAARGLAFEGAEGTFKVTVNGSESEVAATGRAALASDLLIAGANRISVSGSRRPYAVALTLVRRTAPEAVGPLALSRSYALVPPAPPARGGEEPLLAPGGAAKGSEVRALRAGEMVRATLTLSGAGERYLVVEDPIPAGFEAVPETEAGPFTSFSRLDDRVAFFFETAPEEVQVSYVLRAEATGAMRVPPAVLSPMYRPSTRAFSAEAAFTVAAPEEPLDRDETLALAAADLRRLGRAAVSAGRHEDVVKFFTALLDRYDLVPAARAEAYRALARAESALGRPAGTVAAFERLSAEVPAFVPDLADERLRAAALWAVGRHGEAAQALRRAALLLFSADLSVTTELGKAGSILALLDRFPDNETVFAAEADKGAGRFEARIAAGETADHADLATLREFLARFPASRRAPEIGFRLTRAYLRDGDWAALESEARRFADRWPNHARRDDADWFLACALFAGKRYDEAAAAANAQLARTYVRDIGTSGPSLFRPNLLHLLAQVAHIHGKLEEAARLYGEVADQAVDAREALRLLTEKKLAMPEVVRTAAGAESALPVTMKNVPSADLVVHRIDLLLYFTLVKDTARMRDLDLAGIRPAFARTVAPGATAFSMEETVAVGLGKLEPGVYLAIARAGAEEARTVILVSDLEARVWRHAQGARVLVTDRRTGAPAEGAFVKLVVGGVLVAEGLTDARGFFEARGDWSDFEGSAAPKAVAEKDGHFALAP